MHQLNSPPFDSGVNHLPAIFRIAAFIRPRMIHVFQDGCVLLFDDYNCFKASPYYGERRAFAEFLQEQHRFEASPWFTYGFNGAAYFLHERQDCRG